MKSGKYAIIYADPPWSYMDKAMQRGGAERHYKTMSVEAIKQMPIPSIAYADSILFMWATFPKIKEALEVIEAWGFAYKTCAFVWVKCNKRTNPLQTRLTVTTDNIDVFWGMGRYTRSNAEICLLATKGDGIKRRSSGVHQIIYSPIGRHSKKPGETRCRIELLCGKLSRVELFARTTTDGWDVFGDQVKKSIKLMTEEKHIESIA